MFLEEVLDIPQFHLIGYTLAFAAAFFVFSRMFHV